MVLSSSGGAHTSTDTTNPSAPADPEPTKQPAAASTTDTEPAVAELAPEPTHAVEPNRKKSKRAAATPPSLSAPSVERAAATAPAESAGADTPDTAPKPDPVPEVQAAPPKSISLEPVAPASITAVPEPDPEPTGIVETVLASVLAPLVAPGPASPVEPPAMWALLAAARRQFGQPKAAKEAAEPVADPVLTSETLSDLPTAMSTVAVQAALVPAELINTGSVPVGSAPSGIAVSGGKAYVTNRGANTVSVIDTATNTVSATITVGSSPSAVAVSPPTARGPMSPTAARAPCR